MVLMRVPDLDAAIYWWEMESRRWTAYPDAEVCIYCHQEKDQHKIETDSEGIVYHICVHYPYENHAYS